MIRAKRQSDVCRALDYGDCDPGEWLFWRGGSARSEQAYVPLVFSSPNDTTQTRTAMVPRPTILISIDIICYNISVNSARRTKRNSRRVARGFVGGAFVR